jgi:hypothetical protein
LLSARPDRVVSSGDRIHRRRRRVRTQLGTSLKCSHVCFMYIIISTPLPQYAYMCSHQPHTPIYIQPYAVPTSRLTPNVTRYNLPSQNLHVGDVVWLFIDPTLATFVPKKDTSFDRELDLKVTLHHPKAFAKVNPAQRSMLVERYGDPSTWGLPNLEDYDDVPFDPQ